MFCGVRFGEFGFRAKSTSANGDGFRLRFPFVRVVKMRFARGNVNGGMTHG